MAGSLRKQVTLFVPTRKGGITRDNHPSVERDTHGEGAACTNRLFTCWSARITWRVSSRFAGRGVRNVHNPCEGAAGTTDFFLPGTVLSAHYRTIRQFDRAAPHHRRFLWTIFQSGTAFGTIACDRVLHHGSAVAALREQTLPAARAKAIPRITYRPASVASRKAEYLLRTLPLPRPCRYIMGVVPPYELLCLLHSMPC